MSRAIERPLAGGRSGVLPSVLIAAGYLILYILLDLASYVQPVLKLGITPWSPQAGLTLAFLLTRGPRWSPVTAIAALLAEVLVRDRPAAFPILFAASICIALGYGVLAAGLKRTGMPERIESPAAAARFAFAALLMTLTVAVGYVSFFALEGVLPSDVVDESITRYWVGDLNGVLTVTPLLLSAGRWREALQSIWAHRRLVLAQLSAVLLTLVLIFGFFSTEQLRVFYLLFVPVIWIALRWGVIGALLSALAIQVGLIVGVRESHPAPPLLDLQFLMLTVNSTALLLGATILERVAALRRVAVREAEQRALLATAPDAVLVVDSTGRVTVTNSAALRLFGEVARPTAGRAIGDLLPSITLKDAEGRATLEGVRADASVFPAEASWARLDSPASEGFRVIVRDVTERQRSEARLREGDRALARAMRFAMAGELASALTHELNQPITALVSYLRASEILAAPLVSDERLQATLTKAVQEAIRASEVLRRLRDFYQSGTVKREAVQISVLCRSVAVAFQERLARSNVQFALHVPPMLPTVHTGSTQLEIVLHNLFSNAIDAVSQASESERHIEVSGEYDEDEILLYVEDSGPGISAEVDSRLFEPFVTSKADGMGLGLAISRSLLRSQSADLVYRQGTRLGGACFIIRLPRSAASEDRV